MAEASILIEAPPDAVRAVLEDPHAYPKWVVGTDRTLAADPAWPARAKLGLEPSGAHTHVTITENPAGQAHAAALRAPVRWGLHLRNREAVRRLRRLVLQRVRRRSLSG